MTDKLARVAVGCAFFGGVGVLMGGFTLLCWTCGLPQIFVRRKPVCRDSN